MALVLWSCLYTTGQTTFKGIITNDKEEPLSRINVMIYAVESKGLAAYATSDDNGRYEVKFALRGDSVLIKTSSVNYASQSKLAANQSQKIDFTLAETPVFLQGITITAAPVRKYGDTISYLVPSFVRGDDRSIADVLRRMPGIDVERDGTISYQGMPINKFYIDGLDLMEGRYGIVSNNLPAAAVSKVEVLENHQPVRMLRNKVTSQQAALNLTIKKGITTTGLAQLGAGYKPVLWDVNITPMTFTSKFQAVTSFQSNNTGKDVTMQTRLLSANQSAVAGFEEAGKSLLEVVSPSSPDIRQERYLNNKVALININTLQRISKNFELRSNLFYTFDKHLSNASIIRSIYTYDDSLKFSEKIENTGKQHHVLANFSLNRNVNKNFLKNETTLDAAWDKMDGTDEFSGTAVSQTLKIPSYSFQNTLLSYNTFGKHIWEISSEIFTSRSPHSLIVSPMRFLDELIISDSLSSAEQRVGTDKFYTDNGAGLKLHSGRFTISPRLAFSIYHQDFSSELQLQKSYNELKDSLLFKNDISTYDVKGYFTTTIEYRISRVIMKYKLEISQQNVKISDLIRSANQNFDALIANSLIQADYRPDGFWRMNCSAGFTQKLSSFDEIYDQYIMKNFRSLSINNPSLSKLNELKLNFQLEYRNQIISFFNSVKYLYTSNFSAFSNKSKISETGSVIETTDPVSSYRTIHFLQAYTSKYFSNAKTTITVHANCIEIIGKPILNDKRFEVINRIVKIKPECSVRINSKMNLEYSAETNYLLTIIGKESREKEIIVKHNLSYFVFPVKNQLFSLTAEYYKYSQNKYMFIDFLYRYTLEKNRTDFELNCSNLLNSKYYTSIIVSDYQLYRTNYFLRPFQAIFSVRFNF